MSTPEMLKQDTAQEDATEKTDDSSYLKTLVANIICELYESIELEKVGPSTRLEQDLGMDSLDTIEIAGELEEQTDTDITDRDLAQLRKDGGGDITVDALAKHVEKKMQG